MGNSSLQFNNCYEALMRMIQLSADLSLELEKKEKTGKKENEQKIRNIENDFLIIKHSLCDMGIYDECMKFVTMSEEMDELLVDNEQEKDPQRKDALCVRIDGLEYKILEIKHHIDKIPFKRSYNNFINLD
ncbi:MAG: hypothetical protein PUE01_11465 [Clostridiaceae bacterium]|nr:hypothetical protein [Clostridiaceae bacterium]